ncbi:hypothetical protein ABFS82_08G124700 [Erythranthe guttata]|uniref:Germin-like protein n=1 Tax=Erythranthe guttata TaxID=4155 RepID=A0A022RTY7_ERYGU|nr:hypothetical protein MIMGU_mgv1a019377mg [Erythranthe guttata]
MGINLIILILISFVALITCWTNLVLANEPDPLQDFCVADFTSTVRVNGFACLEPKRVTADHFSFKGLNVPGNTSNPLGCFINRPTVNEIPGLNTLGISTVRILTVLDGAVYVGFVTSDPDNRLISKVLGKGDVFVFPLGLVHFQQNVGPGNAVTMAFLNSQNPGVIVIANAVFGSNPPINDDVLAKSFRVDNSIIHQLQAPHY